MRDQVLVGGSPDHDSDEEQRIKREEEPSESPAVFSSAETVDAEDTLPAPRERLDHETHDRTEDWEGLETDNYGCAENNDESAENPEDWSHQWKIDEDVCCPGCVGSGCLRHTMEEAGVHRCPECGKTFADKLYLKRHTIRHAGRRPFTCSVCQKGFTQNAHLRKHVRCHTGERPFKCALCAAAFSLKQNLHRHMTTHSGERSFSCPVCEKGFTQKCHLGRHMSLHLGERPCSCPRDSCEHVSGQARALRGARPFGCPFCGKGFTRRDHLSSHLSAHRGDRRFDCLECGASFNLKQSLERHMAAHSGERPFRCPDCGKGFTRNSMLKLHMGTHTGEKPFSCSQCHAEFTPDYGRSAAQFVKKIFGV